jgi:hypothetical protein
MDITSNKTGGVKKVPTADINRINQFAMTQSFPFVKPLPKVDGFE